MGTVIALLIGSLLTLAGVSTYGGWLPSHADAVFLGLVGAGVAWIIVYGIIVQFVDRTNGNETGIIVAFFGAVLFLLTIIVCPICVLIGGSAWTCFWVGVAIMGAVTALGLKQMS